MTAIYIKNHLPSLKCQDQTPFEIVNGFRPSVNHMRVFGCRAYVLTPKEKRLKWDPKAREGLFMGYEEVSKAYRVYDIEADQVMISRDVTFDESTFVFLQTLPQEIVDDTALEFDSINISDEHCTTQFKQTGKRKHRPSNQEQYCIQTIPTRHGAGSEEASAPDDFESHHAKRRLSTRANLDEERKGTDEDEDDTTSQVFWRASANAVEGADLLEPQTFQDAIDGPNQVHWRKAICAELDSMKIRGVFRATKLPAGQHTIGALRGCSRSNARLMDRSRSTRRVLWQKDSSKNMASTTRRRFRQWSSC